MVVRQLAAAKGGGKPPHYIFAPLGLETQPSELRQRKWIPACAGMTIYCLFLGWRRPFHDTVSGSGMEWLVTAEEYIPTAELWGTKAEPKT